MSKREILSTNLPENIPPYTPMSSLGHELGVLFGFLLACFVVMAVYIVLWRSEYTMLFVSCLLTTVPSSFLFICVLFDFLDVLDQPCSAYFLSAGSVS